MAAPDVIYRLVDDFEANKARYKAPDYNETQVRIQFVNPLFRALGWDVSGHERRGEVVHEDRVLTGNGSGRGPKHPDYGFYTGQDLRFYVETKKPSVNLRDDPDPAYQVRSYGWSAKLLASQLTDFEEFIVYDCRVKPARSDPAHRARLAYYTYTDYVAKWDEIEGLFSHGAVLNNRLDEWVLGRKARGTQTVDDAFLDTLGRWRELLAKDIALHNRGLSWRELNSAVQMIIDRIVFLRIAEDRGIEGYGRLGDFARGAGIYDNLKGLFRQADAKYNSGLFHFEREAGRGDPDNLTLGLTIGDSTLETIINGLYYPASPYRFEVLPADILGQVYERFLGKVIEISNTGAVEIVDKPEVRKAGGVYYTPTYIVDYIVENTVGRLLENKNPDDVARLRILDPACGSGSFLIGAYQYLLDWHLAWYATNELERHVRRGRLRTANGEAGGQYALTTDEKKRILLDNIYGVDLDQQAVEVTKLSLLLKVLEGETAATAQPQLMAERVLPDLGANIKWGNSLIGPDFYAGRQLSYLEDEAVYRVKAFDWRDRAEGFGEIMAAGGFDAVIGNPPYIRIQTMQETAPETLSYYRQTYTAAQRGNYDIYVVFVERGLQLLNPHGRLGYILPHKFFNAKYGEPLRGLIARGKHLAHVVHFGDEQVFSGATTYTNLMFLDKSPREQFHFVRVTDLEAWRLRGEAEAGAVSAAKATAGDWNFVVGNEAELFEKLRSFPANLGDTAHTFVGTQTSADDIFVLDDCRYEKGYVFGTSKALGTEVKVEVGITRPFLRGKQIRRYEPAYTGSCLICPYDTTEGNYRLLSWSRLRQEYPSALDYLESNRPQLEARENGRFKGDDWYAFGYPKSMTLFAKPKIIVPDYNNVASFTFDGDGRFYKTGYGVLINDNRLSPLYILGILNTRLLFWYLLQIGTTLRGGYVRFWTKYIEQLPIRTINFDDPADRARHDRTVALVERMLDLHRQRAGASGAAKGVIEAQIAATDQKIDALVYELYGLTGEEIAIVERASSTMNSS